MESVSRNKESEKTLPFVNVNELLNQARVCWLPMSFLHFNLSLTMRPKLPPPPHATPMKKRQSVNLLQAAESFFYVAGMMATLSVAGYQESGTRGSGRRCEKGNTVRRPMPGARPDSDHAAPSRSAAPRCAGCCARRRRRRSRLVSAAPPLPAGTPRPSVGAAKTCPTVGSRSNLADDPGPGGRIIA